MTLSVRLFATGRFCQRPISAPPPNPVTRNENSCTRSDAPLASDSVPPAVVATLVPSSWRSCTT
jgi:hypothetical protein